MNRAGDGSPKSKLVAKAAKTLAPSTYAGVSKIKLGQEQKLSDYLFQLFCVKLNRNSDSICVFGLDGEFKVIFFVVVCLSRL